MRSLNLILMLLGALSMLMLGATPASAMAGDATAPCHEIPASSPSHDGDPVPSEERGKDMTAMACCAGCVVAPAARPSTREQVILPGSPDVLFRPVSLPVGLSPAPEHGPPKA